MQERKLLFNPKGTDEIKERKILGGNSTNLFNLNNVKYKWANQLYRAMMANFWIPEKVNVSNDINDYKKLTPEEKRAYNGILSFLVFLDSIQTNNLPNISDYITAPEINLALSVQVNQEAVHSQSYAYLIESAVPVSQRKNIYEFWKTDEVLFKRNEYIASIFQNFVDEDSDDNFARAIIADYLLEGIYFYNGFNFFYNLASRNMMSGTADIIKYIHRDELTHCSLFQKIINTVREENPDLIKDELIYEMTKNAVEHEISWGKYIIGEGVLGMSPKAIEDHTHWLANGRLKSLKLEPIFPEVSSNPFAHLNKIADVGSKAESKGNFFERTVTSYNQSNILDGWDKI